MGACLQKQGLDKAENTKASAVVPSWASSPTYIDEDEGKVKLVGDVTCPHTQSVRIALLHKGVPVQASLVMPDDLRSYKGENSATISAEGKYPVFQHGDHRVAGSIDAILAYIDETFASPPLLPNGLEKEVSQWVSYIRDAFTPVIEELLYNGDPFAQEALEARLNESLACLDSGIQVHQNQGRFFLGSKFTLVDVYLIPFLSLMDLVTYIKGVGISSSYSSLSAYKSAMCTFKCYKPVQVGMDLSRSVLVKSSIEQPPQPLVSLTILQHKSIVWHLVSFEKLVKELDNTNRQPSMDTRQRTVFGMQLKELPKVYGRLLQIMQEHAQMEERVIFPALEMADQALTETALRDHARDLPVMNGIREDIKGIIGLRQGTSDHCEALSALVGRVEAFQAHVVDHFQEEEREQLPLLQAAGYGTKKQQPMVGQAFVLMESSHSSLLPYLLEGLKPHEVHQYLGLMKWSTSDSENKSLLPRIAHDLNNEEFEGVWKLALERVPSLGGSKYTKYGG